VQQRVNISREAAVSLQAIQERLARAEQQAAVPPGAEGNPRMAALLRLMAACLRERAGIVTKSAQRGTKRR
jgi:hypothetical protein